MTKGFRNITSHLAYLVTLYENLKLINDDGYNHYGNTNERAVKVLIYSVSTNIWVQRDLNSNRISRYFVV